MRTSFRLITIGALTVAAGFGVGSAVAGNPDSEENPPPIEAATPGKYAEELDPYITLGNGKTAGNYRIETPLDERPDFVPTRTADGKPGYVRVEHFDDRVIDVPRDGSVHQLTDDEQQRLIDAERTALKPNGRGELWAPVYAEDGETQIGQVLLNSPDPELER